MEDEKTFAHESYGIVGLSRMLHGMGKTRLFGSAIDTHHSTIVLKVQTAERRHYLAMDWFHARKTVVEVELSSAQFAELLTTMNMGDGVPCTIRYIGGKQMEPPPAELIEAEEVQSGFDRDCETLGRKLRTLATDVTAIVGGSRWGKAEKDTVTQSIDSIIQMVSSNLPFVAASFQEATGKMVTAAKAEADAFLTNAITRAGFNALRSGSEVIQIGDGDEHG